MHSIEQIQSSIDDIIKELETAREDVEDMREDIKLLSNRNSEENSPTRAI